MPRRKKSEQPQQQLQQDIQQVSGEDYTHNSISDTQQELKPFEIESDPDFNAENNDFYFGDNVDLENAVEEGFYCHLPALNQETVTQQSHKETLSTLALQDEETAIQDQQSHKTNGNEDPHEEVEYSPLVRKLAAIAQQEITTAQVIAQAKNEAILGTLRNSDNRLLETIDGALDYRRQEYERVVEDLGKGDLW